MHVDLEVSSCLTPPRARLTVTGELDLATAVEVEGTIDRSTASGCTFVGVDLAGVTFVDSVGIDTLVAAHHRLDAASSRLWVSGVSPQVARMMVLTGTDALFGLGDLAPAGS